MTMDSALINIVRRSFAASTVENDYTTGQGELAVRHEEIALADPTGDPCAIPVDTAEDVIDYGYDYATGARGSAVRGSLMAPSLSIDYIDNVVARRLDQWRRERAIVQVAPNIGRSTVYSWRANDLKGSFYNGGGAAKDSTGNYLLTSTCGQYLRYWDTGRGAFIPKTSANRTPIIPTPGGAGLITYPSVVNRMSPTYPKSATLSTASTASGWATSGTDAADITAALVTGGFGMADCPDSLRVSVAARATVSRSLVAYNQFNSAHADYAGYTFVDGLAVSATVWLRGRLPDAAMLQLGAIGAADYTSHNLGGLRLDGWTPVTVTHLPTGWTGHVPTLGLLLNDNTGMACEFEIGPTMIVQQSGYSAAPGAAVWSPQTSAGTVSGSCHVATASAFRMPAQGSLTASFWCPDDIDASWRSASAAHALCGNSEVDIRVGSTSTTNYVRVAAGGNTITTSTAVGGVLVAGSVCTVTVTWSSAGVLIYANGTLISTTTATLPAITGSSSVWKIGGNVGNYGCAPLAMLTCRIDEGAMTAAEVRRRHAALTDPVALGLAIRARGRSFRIVRVPSTLRPSAGGSQILGNLTLEQVDFDQFTADPFLREKSIG